MTFHEEVLPAVQRDVLRKLGPILTQAGFDLGGGTACAIQLGHRKSLDFDWFTGQPLGDPAVFAGRIQRMGIGVAAHSFDAGTVHGSCDGIPVSFFEYRYPSLAARVRWPEYDCDLISLQDLACMKLSAVASRGAKKDFIDLFALGTSGLNLNRMLELYRQKYELTDIGHVVVSLTYFDDAELEEMPTMLWSVTWAEVKLSIERWVREFTREFGGVGEPE